MPARVPPKVTAIVATILGPRSEASRTTRTDEICSCVRSILANSYEPLTAVVVDQSPSDAVYTALRPLLEADARLRYMHTDIAGMSRAQNLAINSSDADLFTITDDDCVVPSDWIESIVATFRRHPDAGILFGDVRPPAQHDWTVMYVPSLHFPSERLLPATFLPRTHNLMGANMAVSRAALARIGLFDELLGPGSKYGAYNVEVDLHLRALRVRPPIGVYLTPAFHVVHEHGGRPQGVQARQLLQTYQSGKSSFLTKHALRGDLGAAAQLALLALEPFVDAGISLVRTGRPRGLGMIAPYVSGIRRGMRVAHASRIVPLEGLPRPFPTEVTGLRELR